MEGFKDSDLLKVEVWRAPEPGQVAKPVRYPEDDFVVAVATDAAASLPQPTQLPLLDLNQPAQPQLGDQLLDQRGLATAGEPGKTDNLHPVLLGQLSYL